MWHGRATDDTRGDAVAPLSDPARHVLEARYLRRDARGEVAESPAELFERVARAVAEGERVSQRGAREARSWEERFHRMMADRLFLPNSPTLMNAGTPIGQLSACFVLPVEDSLEQIFDAVKSMALVQRTGGGTGFSFSALRPQGDVLGSSGGRASGPSGFIEVFDCVTRQIQQGGRRRGANMAVLRCDHPDVLDFVRAKVDGVSLPTFNLSVGVTDAFMEAAARGETYPLVHPRTGAVPARISAREVLDAIADAAWRCGDPGLLFLDAVERDNPVPALGRLESTNPCGEVPLLPYEACNLGSINLARMTRDAGGRAVVDWELLRETTARAVRFLDDVITVSRAPQPEVERAVERTRKIGLGVMGLAELFLRLDLRYGSEESLELAAELMRAVGEQAHATSRALAEERGAFPAWHLSRFAARGVPMRNATCTAIAPTGTIGMLAETSASIEPLFALAYRRTVATGEAFLVASPLLLERLDALGARGRALLDRVMATGSLAEVEDAPEELRRVFVTALDLPASSHLRMAAAFQRHVDNSVSKTVNLPAGARVDDVASAYRAAWELGLKGITVFRYGSKGAQVLDLAEGEAPHHYDHASRCDPYECRV